MDPTPLADSSKSADDLAYLVGAFYRFVKLADAEAVVTQFKAALAETEIRGSILVAPEGINGTIAGPRDQIESFFGSLRTDARFAAIEVKWSHTKEPPFRRMKVRLKKEIVTFGQPVDPTVRVGTYVSPTDWNQVVTDPDVLVIDTRNDEEVQLGSFVNAVNPVTESFTEFAAWADALDPTDHQRVAMFCTGGIRCEKASAYLLDRGFTDVMHLQGGILNYLEQVPAEESTWRGDCFVFDERVSVDHRLEPGDYSLCRGCRRALSAADRSADGYEPGVSCLHCVHTVTDDRRQRLRERHRQVLLAELRGEDHIGRHE